MVKLYQLTCPNCGAVLGIETDKNFAFCQYCGKKIYIDDGVERKEINKTYKKIDVARIKENETREKIRMQEIEQEKYRIKSDSQDKRRNWLKDLSGALIPLIFIAFGALIFMVTFGSQENKHDEKITQLEQIELEIEKALDEEDFDTALIKANQLYCDDGWSSEATATWDAKRESYIKIIEERKREAELNDPNNIFMPSDSEYFKGKNLDNVVDQFVELGFTNIEKQVASEKATVFKKSGTIEHILIAGKTEFTTEDYFDKDSKIIIYYYSK